MADNRDFFDVLDAVISKSIDAVEKAVKDAEPSATSWLLSLEQWLDAKLNDSEKT